MDRSIGKGCRALAAALLALAGCGGAEEELAASGAALGSAAPAYLALGDSVAFGYDPFLVPPQNDNVFVGYPERLSDALALPLENAACPGETTESFTSPRADGMAGMCARFKGSGWLHAQYTGTQLDHALSFLRAHQRTRLVTIALGANDVFDLQAGCALDIGCVLAGLPAVRGAIADNVTRILAAIRKVYAGRIVVPLYYAPKADPFTLGATSVINGALAEAAAANGAETVDVFSAFLAASAAAGYDPCAAGLLIPDGDACDIHPSETGAALIAATIAPTSLAP